MNPLSFKEQLKQEGMNAGDLSKELVQLEEDTHLGYMVKLVRELGRPISEEEEEFLSNIW